MLKDARQPHFGLGCQKGKAEAGGKNSHHRHAAPIERNRLADCFTASAKMPAPKTVSDDGDVRSSLLVLLGQKPASFRRLDAEYVKKIAGGVGAVDLLGCAVHREAQ